DERRLAGARKSHDHEDLSALDVERHIVEANDMAALGKKLGFRFAGPKRGQRALRVGPEDLGYAAHRNGDAIIRLAAHWRASAIPMRPCNCLPKAWVMRSKTMASTTMP